MTTPKPTTACRDRDRVTTRARIVGTALGVLESEGPGP
jgi:hypothetical protein